MTNRKDNWADDRDGGQGGGTNSLDSDSLQGWERAVTSNGIPYFINLHTEKTTWDHPLMTQALGDLEGHNYIKYAAYRMAMKLRRVQKITRLNEVPLICIEDALESNNIVHGRVSWNSTMSVAHSETVITDIFQAAENNNMAGAFDIPECTDLALNWLLNTYDSGRTGLMHTLSFIIGVVFLCQGELNDKFETLVLYCADERGGLSRSDCEKFLQDCVQIPRQFFESTFGSTKLIPAIASLAKFVGKGNAEDFHIHAGDMLQWLKHEPETIVWLPTMHRLAAAETVRHESKCSSCKAFPIVGLRYRCLKCLNYDQCQTCFFDKKVSHKHKDKHPMKEYCMLTTSGEDVKDLWRSIRNKLSTKSTRRRHTLEKQKSSFLPLPQLNDSEVPAKAPSLPVSDVHGDIQDLRQRLTVMDGMAQHLSENVEDDHLLTLQLLGQAPKSLQDFPDNGRDPQDLAFDTVRQLTADKNEILQQLQDAQKERSRSSHASSREKKELEGYIRQLQERIRQLEAQLHGMTRESQASTPKRVSTSARKPSVTPVFSFPAKVQETEVTRAIKEIADEFSSSLEAPYEDDFSSGRNLDLLWHGEQVLKAMTRLKDSAKSSYPPI